jgi:hypothetical protein
MHLSQLENVEGTDSSSLAVFRAHSGTFAGLILAIRCCKALG